MAFGDIKSRHYYCVCTLRAMDRQAVPGAVLEAWGHTTTAFVGSAACCVLANIGPVREIYYNICILLFTS